MATVDASTKESGMNYEDMSDFEINKAVADCVGMCWHATPSITGEGWEYSSITRKSSSHITQELPDYCNNPSDAWPVIKESKIGIVPVNGQWRASSVVSGYHEQHDDNPLRAAMIVFLMMKDAQHV